MSIVGMFRLWHSSLCQIADVQDFEDTTVQLDDAITAIS
jgi:hypothetical protein